MGFVAILGAGPLGGALAHKLAGRDRLREIRLIDPEGAVARGKALDILQSAPVESFSTRITVGESIRDAAGADAIVLADAASGAGEHVGEAGLALLKTLGRLETRAPVLCAGAGQRQLLERAVAELRLASRRLCGSAPAALESAVRAVTALALDASPAEVSLRIVGVPPANAVVGWDAASAFGQPLGTRLPPHEIAAITARIPGLWPPAPYALASAAARCAEALVLGSRRRFSCFVVTGRVAVTMPVELAPGGVRRVLEPSLSRQERTRFENALEASSGP